MSSILLTKSSLLLFQLMCHICFFEGNIREWNLQDVYNSQTRSGGWIEPVNLHDFCGIKAICPVVTMDDTYFFYLDYVNSISQPFWVSAEYVDELKTNE